MRLMKEDGESRHLEDPDVAGLGVSSEVGGAQTTNSGRVFIVLEAA